MIRYLAREIKFAVCLGTLREMEQRLNDSIKDLLRECFTEYIERADPSTQAMLKSLYEKIVFERYD